MAKPKNKDWNWMAKSPLLLQPSGRPEREACRQAKLRHEVDDYRLLRELRQQVKEVWE